MTIAEFLRQKTKEDTLRSISTAIELIKNNTNIEEIMNHTNLSKTEVENLEKQIKSLN